MSTQEYVAVSDLIYGVLVDRGFLEDPQAKCWGPRNSARPGDGLLRCAECGSGVRTTGCDRDPSHAWKGNRDTDALTVMEMMLEPCGCLGEWKIQPVTESCYEIVCCICGATTERMC